ncbi:nitroreductase family protein [Actinokineospora pegani]|uniref:nitroreductase family protein n=1 Tax=Actinokineospora pegani TaxID=2654637 RepID=UPI0018D3C0DF|nr:nitroreductase family protein [Actinokineospora pegani]
MNLPWGVDVDEQANPTLTRFWDETRLRAATAIAAPVATSTRRGLFARSWAAVSEVLCVGYGERSGTSITKGRSLIRARTTPSAGALYPVEVLVALGGPDGYELHHYDVAGCCLRYLRPIAGGALNALLPEVQEQPSAVVVVVGRPWLSMRKYGRRGYLYTHLDGGHVANNIAVVAEDAGFDTRVHLRFDRTAAAGVLGIDPVGREPQTLITLHGSAEPTGGPDRAANPFAVPVWRDDQEGGLEPTDDEERAGWHSIDSISTYHAGPRSKPVLGSMRSVVATAGGEPGVPLAVPDPLGTAPLRSTVLRRKSAKGFLPSASPADELGRALAALRATTPVDCADGVAVGVRLLLREVSGTSPGAYAYLPDEHGLRPLGGDAGTSEEVITACMRQDVVRSAAVVIALHAPVRRVLAEHGTQGLAELHFHAAAAAQRLCLGATAHGLGITCLGGFDEHLVADLVRLEPAEEVLYVLAAGVADESAVKWDRAPVAHSHGLASRIDS